MLGRRGADNGELAANAVPVKRRVRGVSKYNDSHNFSSFSVIIILSVDYRGPDSFRPLSGFFIERTWRKRGCRQRAEGPALGRCRAATA